MAAALGGLGLLQGRVRLAAAAAATSSLGRPGRRAPVRGGAAAAAAAAALPSAGRSYGSEAKEEEELRVRYLDDEHKGNEGKAAGAALPPPALLPQPRQRPGRWAAVTPAGRPGGLGREGEVPGGAVRRRGAGRERRLLLLGRGRWLRRRVLELLAWRLQNWASWVSLGFSFSDCYTACTVCARYTFLSWHLLATLMGESEV